MSRLFAVLILALALAGSAFGQTPDLRPTFMGKVYRFENGPNAGKIGYLFRIWNRSGADQSLASLPGRFNQPTFGILSDDGRFADGTPSWAGAPPKFTALFTPGPQVLRASPSETFADRPANIIVLTAATTTQIVYTLNGRTATGALANATVEIVGGGTLSGRLEVVAVNAVRTLPEGTEIAVTVSNGLNRTVTGVSVRAYPASSAITVRRDRVNAGTLGSGATFTPSETLLVTRSSGTGFALSDFVFAFDDDTVAGLDVDNDGIRDDIEVYIDQVLAATPAQRWPLRALAKGSRMSDLATTQEQARAGHDFGRPFVSCAILAFGLNNDVVDRLELETSNTDDRVRAMINGMQLQGTLPTYTLPSRAERAAFCNDPANQSH